MSKQKGLIKLEGAIGDIVFYQSGGKHLARISNGPSKDRIAKDAAFARTRENNKEFGGAATASKALRLSLPVITQTMADRYFVSRLVKVFKEICNRDTTSARGQRSFLVSANKTVLESVDFNDGLGFSSVFTAPFTATNVAERNRATIAVANFFPSSFIAAPAGATHFRLIHALGVVSDYVYDANLQDYRPVDAVLNSVGVFVKSDSTELNGTAAVNFSLDAELPGAPVMSADVSVAQCFGIEFYQRIGAVDYLLAQGNTAKIVKVF